MAQWGKMVSNRRSDVKACINTRKRKQFTFHTKSMPHFFVWGEILEHVCKRVFAFIWNNGKREEKFGWKIIWSKNGANETKCKLNFTLTMMMLLTKRHSAICYGRSHLNCQKLWKSSKLNERFIKCVIEVCSTFSCSWIFFYGREWAEERKSARGAAAADECVS